MRERVVHIARGSARRTALCVAAAATLCCASGAAQAHMTGQDYRVAKTRLDAQHRDADSRCDALGPDARAFCKVESRSAARVAQAQLAYRHSTTARLGVRLLEAKADAAFAIDAQQCRAMSEATACLRGAARVHATALGAATAHGVSGAAEKAADEDARTFDYEDFVAVCARRPANTEAGCIRAAGWQFDRPMPLDTSKPQPSADPPAPR